MDVMKTAFLRRVKASDKFPPFSFIIANRSVITSHDQLLELRNKTHATATTSLKEVNLNLKYLC